jgi:hypothetical protein
MEDQLIAWHFDCGEPAADVDEPTVSLGLTVSKARVLRGLEHFWGKEYTAWTCSTRGRLEFPPRPWQCACQQRFFAAEAPVGERELVLQLAHRQAVITAFDVLMGRPFAAAVLAMISRQRAGI